MPRHSALLAVLFLLPVAAFAQEEHGNVDWNFKNKKLRDQIAAYEKAVKKLDAAFQERQSSLKEAYDEKRKDYRLELIVQFEEALQEATKAVDLKEANKIDAAIKALHGGAEPAGVAGRAGSGIVRIPKDAVEWSGHHYKVFTTAMTWHVAQAKCEVIGGHLVRIECAKEQTFVEQLTDGVEGLLWIDGSDEAHEGKWIFGNGNGVRYFNWRRGEPNNTTGPLKGSSHAVAIAKPLDGEWVDNVTGDRIAFICEWDQ